MISFVSNEKYKTNYTYVNKSSVNISDNEDEYSNRVDKINVNLNTTNITKDDPFIDYLIERRIGYCKNDPSSHIAAFVPKFESAKYCFLSGRKGKGRNR